MRRFISSSRCRYLPTLLMLMLAASCIRVSSDPTAVPAGLATIPPTAETTLAPTIDGTAAPSSSPGSASGGVAIVAPEAAMTSVPRAGQSLLAPITLSQRWRFESAEPLSGLSMTSLDGGPLPDIIAGSRAGTVYTMGLDEKEYWRHSIEGPVDFLATIDLDLDGIGEVALGNKARLALLEGGEMRWQYEAPSAIRAILASERVIPGQAAIWLGTSEGEIIGIDDQGTGMWELRPGNEAITQIIPARIEASSEPSILAATVSGQLSAITSQGRLLWQVDLGGPIHQVITADLQGDGTLEIAAGTEGGLVVLDSNGQLLSRWFNGEQIAALTAIAIDRGGRAGIVATAGSHAGQIALVDGSALRWQLAISDHSISFLTTFDLDGDGFGEIVAGDTAGELLIVDREGGLRGHGNVDVPASEVRIVRTMSEPAASRVAVVVRADRFIYLFDAVQQSAAMPPATEASFTPEVTAVTPAQTERGRPHYELSVLLDMASHEVAVEQIFTMINDSSLPWDELVFHVSPAYWSGVFTLNETTLLEPGPTLPTTSTLEQTVLRVALPTPLAPEEQVSLFLAYSLRLPKLDPVAWGPAGNAGWGPNLVQLGDWYPSIVPFEEGAGWQTWRFVPVGDPVKSGLSDYDVSISAPPGTTIAAAGYTGNDGDVSQYRLRQARAFGFTASADYARFDAAGGIAPVQLYISSAEQSKGPVVLETAGRALTLFEELYGAYPYSELVLAENGFLTSNEYSGFISLGGYLFDVYDGRTDSLLVAITAHEVAHQWWYGAVGNDQVWEPWLDEGLAMLSELFYYERYHPELVEQWWQFRVDRWQPSGAVDASVYDFNDSAAFVHNVYGQSAHFLQRLREVMGDAAFKGFLREYYQQNAGGAATGETFFSLAQAHTSADVSAVRSLYFNQ